MRFIQPCLRSVPALALLILLPAARAACVTPTDGMVVVADTELCAGVYILPNGITIGADNVTLSGAGTEIRGANTGYGIYATGRQNVTVTKLTVKRYFHALHFYNCDDLTITNCNVWETPELPEGEIFLNIFDGPTGSYAHAVWLRYCDRATITYNDVAQQQNGISLFNCTQALVAYNEASYNTGWGIYLYDTDESVIRDNIADYCTRDYGGWSGADAASLLMVYGSSNNHVLDNSLVGGGDGVFLAGATHSLQKRPCNDNYFARNDCSDSPNNGFEGTFSQRNIYEDNVTDRCNYGYWLGYSTFVELRNNRINDCTTSGIAIEHGHDNLIEDNVITGNGNGVELWTDDDSSLVYAYPENRDSYNYIIRNNLIVENSMGAVCSAIGTNRFSYNYEIYDNTFQHNGTGIWYTYTTDSTIHGNWIGHQLTRGVRLSNGTGNAVYNNFFFGNANHAADDSGNAWNVAKTTGPNIAGGPYIGGNYWSTYTGVDTDGDGLGDTLVPFTDSGHIGGDALPLIWDDPDCNDNGITDATEPDCNENGTPDECDIADGTSLDCNGNGVPDVCDIATGASADCNANGIPDDCEPDCNANGVADSCDIAAGTSLDANGNGVPDECDIGPQVLSVTPTGGTALLVQFSKVVDAASAQQAVNYTASHGVTVLGALRDAGGNTVTLTTTPLPLGATCVLSVADVFDTGEPPTAVQAETHCAFRYGPETRVADGLIVRYDFDEGAGSVVYDVSGVGTPLNLYIADPNGAAWFAGGLALRGTCLSSAGAATKLASALMDGHEITLEAWLVPATIVEHGPARIMTCSNTSYAHNFLLGQGPSDGSVAAAFDVRLRTPFTDINGLPAVTTPDGAVAARLTHMVYSRGADDVGRLYVDGVEEAASWFDGALDNWNSYYWLVLGSELTGEFPWHGAYRLVAIYERGLSASEVWQNYAASPNASGDGQFGDLNCDGTVDFFDIDPFVLALTGPANYAAAYPACSYYLGDCNADGVVNFFDIDAFVVLLTD